MSWHGYFKSIRKNKRLKSGLLTMLMGSILYLAWGLTEPIFNIRINEITGSLALSGLVFAVWPTIGVLMGIPAGVISDRKSPKKVLKFAILCYIVIVFMYTVVDSVIPLILLRVVHAVFGSLYWIPFFSILRDVPKSYIDEQVNLYEIASNLSGIIGPILGSYLILLFSWKMPFYIVSISYILQLFIASKLADRKGNTKKAEVWQGVRSFFRKEGALGVIIGFVVAFFVSSILYSFLPIILNEKGFGLTEIGIIIAVGLYLPWIIFPFLGTPILESNGVRKTVMFGLLVSIVGFFMLSKAHGFVGILLSVFIIESGASIRIPTINTKVGLISEKDEAGRFTGITETTKHIGGIFGSLAGGVLVQNIGMQTFSILGALLIIALPITYKMLK